jgi:antitoxin VapB
MPLNIKDPRTHDLAQKLAQETGETMTKAVTVAIRERLERIKRQRKAEVTARELLEIGRRCASRLKKTPIDHAILLYDDRGLPR